MGEGGGGKRFSSRGGEDLIGNPISCGRYESDGGG
jgi:hypothetical protein